MQIDDKLKRRIAGAAVLLAATFVIVSILPTPEQAARQPGVDVVTIPLHDVVSQEPPPPSAASTPPTLAAPVAHGGEGTDAQEVDIAGDDDGPGDGTEGAAAQNAPAPRAVPMPKSAERAADQPSTLKPAEPAPARPAGEAAEKPVAKVAEKAPAPRKPAAPPIRKAEEKAATEAAPASSGNWSVQVGGFSDIGRARGVQDKLKALGQASFISPMDTSKGTLYRVRAGPYATREAAQAAQDRLNGSGYPEARLVGP
ncbi:MAG: SPOR domain-containing protein [Solimonas sp.]